MSTDIFSHPQALVESSAIGKGTKIFAFSHVMNGAVIGEACKIANSVFVEAGAVLGNRITVKNGISIWDGVTIEDDVFLGPHAIFTNVMSPRAFIKRKKEEFSKTLVKKGATIGAGAVIVCGHTVGAYAFVAAGAVVTRDVPDYGLVKGNPARLAAYTCKCLNTRFKLGSTAGSCADCGTKNPQAV